MSDQNKEKEMHEAFVKASLNFRKPSFTNKVAYGRTNFEYANLAEILDCINEPLLKAGFYIKHDFYIDNDQQYIKTYLQYKNGLTLGNVIFPLNVKNKTMQEIGGQITYLKRYSISSICSIFADSDNDGKEVEGQKVMKTIDEKQAKEILALLNKDVKAWELLKKEYGYSKVTDITTNRFESIKTTLKLYNQKKESDSKMVNMIKEDS